MESHNGYDGISEGLLILPVRVSQAFLAWLWVDFIQSRQRKFLIQGLDGPKTKSQRNSSPCCWTSSLSHHFRTVKLGLNCLEQYSVNCLILMQGDWYIENSCLSGQVRSFIWVQRDNSKYWSSFTQRWSRKVKRFSLLVKPPLERRRVYLVVREGGQ